MKLLVITQKVDQNDQLLGFFIRWLELLAKYFEKLAIICLEKGEYRLPDNVKVLFLGKEKKNFQFSIFKKIKYFLRFWEFLWRERKNYDAVFVHMSPIWVILGGWWWRLTGKKIFFWYTSGGVTRKLKWAEKWAQVIFTASPESFRLPSKKLMVTGHGIDTEIFKPAGYQPEIRPDEYPFGQTGNYKLKILSVGRITPVKNYGTLVETAKILKDRGVNFSVTMVGEAPLEEDKNYELRIKNQVKELGLEKYFNFVGKVSHQELPAYYQSHDLFVHLSKTGSLDKVLLEAMACGMKVLSSSEVAGSFLPPNLIFDDQNPAELADKTTKRKNGLADINLREYVMKNHDLGSLISKISKIIKLGE